MSKGSRTHHARLVGLLLAVLLVPRGDGRQVSGVRSVDREGTVTRVLNLVSRVGRDSVDVRSLVVCISEHEG